MYLVKNVSQLRPTYQIKLLTFHAVESGKKLVLKVPRACRFHPRLEDLVNENRKHIEREDL
ncbi:MAG: hypothetical protein QOJ27_2530 [Sphingomonadales bacterium]|jgi:hypothetical protein|nr:hypothetical protein [Sphingomonadales bacterium]